MRASTVAALLFLLPAVLPEAALAAACSGEACGALTSSADGCSWTNTGTKPVRLAMSSAAAGSPVVMILAPGEMFKAAAAQCAKPSGDSATYQASFAVLRAMPEEKPVVPVPKAKPVAVVAAAAPTVAAVATPAVAPAPVAVAAIVVPRAKPAPPPAYPPLPRLKPAAPVEAVAAVAPEAAALVEPAAVVATDEAPGCGEACGEILFKVVDACVWVQSQNPRPIAFEASVGGKAVKLMLEGANGAKADMRAAVLAKAGAEAGKADAAYHTRLHDPFQSAGPGIAVYRVRLGSAEACVKGREEITTFAARFAK